MFGKAMVVAGVVAALLGSGASAAQARTWTVSPTPNPGPDEDVLFAATRASSSDVWAVGRAVYGPTGAGGTWKPMIARLGYTGWHVVPGGSLPPAVILSELSGVASRTPDDAWAVGIAVANEGRRWGLVEHWNGRRWRTVRLTPFFHEPLNAITLVSGTRTFWAVGGFNGGAGAAFWNGAAWHRIAVPQPAIPGPLNGVAAFGQNDVWAVGSPSFPGFAENAPPFAEHWNGSGWTLRKLPGGFGKYDSPAVVAVSAVPGTHQLWAVGYVDSGTSFREDTVLYHFTGGHWHRVASPDPRYSNALYGVTALGPANVWAWGYSENRGDRLPHALILHLTASGVSPVPPTGKAAHGVLRAGAFTASRLWAVGSTTFPDNGTFAARTLAVSTRR